MSCGARKLLEHLVGALTVGAELEEAHVRVWDPEQRL
jgi:hypothetical protein